MSTIRTEPLQDPALRRAALELYASAWPPLPRAIADARRLGSEWFAVSTPSFLMEGERMVAHAGQVWCDLLLDGRRSRVAALHAVVVDPEHRGRGHGRAVLEAALARLDALGAERVILWSEKVALYERFGFRPVAESAFRLPAPAPDAVEQRALDLDHPHDQRLLRRLLAQRTPVSARHAALDDGWHFLIDCAIERPPAGSMRYLPAREAIVVASPTGRSTLRVLDVVARELPELAAIAGAFPDAGRVDTIELLFSPDRLAPRARAFAHPLEDVLQVRGADLRSPQAEPFAFSPFART